jgi:hypothetical protein
MAVSELKGGSRKRLQEAEAKRRKQKVSTQIKKKLLKLEIKDFCFQLKKEC